MILGPRYEAPLVLSQGQSLPLGSQHVALLDPLAFSWLRVNLSYAHTARSLPYYRDALDHKSPEQMTWQPYTRERLIPLPPICTEDRHIWRTRSPLIFFDIVTYYLPDRILRQFGYAQGVPALYDTSTELHVIDRRASNKNYAGRHRPYVEMWENRETG